MKPTHAHQMLAEALDMAAEELDALISRRFTTNRTIKIEQAPNGWYCATMDDGSLRFPPCPNLDVVVRFVRAFAIQTAGVTVDEGSVERFRHSVRVPSNVVPIRAGA
jgi:predicted ribosome-associated RNA-binding protein Tma20